MTQVLSKTELKLNWVAVQELLSRYDKMETQLSTTYPYPGNLNKVL